MKKSNDIIATFASIPALTKLLCKNIEAVHEELKQFKCTECEFSSGHHYSLKNHKRSVHLNKAQGIKCD